MSTRQSELYPPGSIPRRWQSLEHGTRSAPSHLPAHLTEMEFRFNRRKNPDLFVDTLRHMVTAPILTFEKLTA
jgi:hypothetical protein